MGGKKLREADPLEEKLTGLLEPVVRSEGLILVEVAWRREPGGQKLRLVVDRPQGGVTLDECAMVSRQAGDLLDVEDLIPVAYNLEVSSPGLNRKLKGPREYELFAGRPARLVVRDDETGHTFTYEGLLKGLVGSDVILDTHKGVKAFPLDSVAGAKLIDDGSRSGSR